MSFEIFDNDITQLSIDGAEQKTLTVNGAACFGKRYSLSKKPSSGVSLEVTRTSSPYQGAGRGIINTGKTIYYGDSITIKATASSGYGTPKLYVDIGDGNGLILRSTPFGFTVTNNVEFYGQAEAADTKSWCTLFSGTKTDTWTGYLQVNGLSECSDVRVSASAIFEDYYIDPVTENRYDGARYDARIEREKLPTSLNGCTSSINLKRNGNKIEYQFNEGWCESKGFVCCEEPVSVTITEVQGYK